MFNIKAAKRMAYSSKLRRMIFIPDLPEYYRNEAISSPQTFREESHPWLVRVVGFALLPFLAIVATAVVIGACVVHIWHSDTFDELF